MKILHVVHNYYPALGGAERLLQRVSENLVHLYKDEVTVFTGNGRNNEAFNDPAQSLLPIGADHLNGVHIERFPIFNRLGKPLYHLQNIAYRLKIPGNQYLRTLYHGPILPGLGPQIKTFEADVVAAAAFPLLHMFTTQRACRLSKKPLVFIGALHPLNEWGFQRPMIYKAIRQAEAYIALSEYEKDYLVQTWGITEQKIHVIGSGVNMKRFEQADGQLFRQAHNLQDDPIIAFIGQHGVNKGIDTLLYSLTAVWQKFPEAKLLIAGAQTHFTPQLKKIARQQFTERQQNNLIWISNFSEAEKPALFAACDIFAYPSAFESFGIAYIEAWSAQKPVIGCFAGAVPTIIEEGVDGLLVPVKDSAALADKLIQLLQDSQLRQAMGAAGYQKVEQKYSWPRVITQWRHVYESVVPK